MKFTLALALGLSLLGGAARAADNPLGLKADHVTAAVTDIDRAVSWYRDMLGFHLVDRGERQNGQFKYADLAIPGFGIGLVQLPTATPAAAASPVASGWLHIVFSVPDPAASFKSLQSRGAKVSIRPGTPPGPVTTFLISDSEGNEIEIVAAGAK